MLRKLLVVTGWTLLWTLAVIAVVLAESRWFAEPAVVRGEFASIENHLIAKLSDATARRRLGSAALVLVHRGEIAVERGFGPVKTDQTLFQVASVSKAVTAWGVMKLVEDGKLGLDEPVMRHMKRWRFPGSDAHRDKVTVRHLLSHTAGLDDGLGYGGFLPGEKIQTLEESLTLTKDSTVGEPRAVIVAREPGRSLSYSGGGYTVLELLIEEVTQQSFTEFMKEAVLQPLGMTKSGFDWEVIASEGRAADLAPSFDSALKPQPRRRYTAKAAVALYATPHDLAQFVLAFTRENRVLRPETIKRMITPQPGTSGSWGLGHTLYGGGVVGHSGGTLPAWGAMVRVNPGTRNGLVMVVSGGQGSLNKLPHDWLYWETGQITSEARLQIVQNRIVPASLAITVGAILIALWKLLL